MKRLLVLAYYFPPMGMSGVQRIARIARHLPDHGWQPTVVTASPKRYAAWDDELERHIQNAGVEVVRTRSLDPLHLPTPDGRRATHPLPAGEERGAKRFGALGAWLIPDSKVGWLPFALHSATSAHRDRPFDAVLATGPPHSALVGAAWASGRLNIPLVLDFRDDWVDAPRQRFATRLHRRAHAALERWAIKRADDIWTVSEPIARSIQSRHAVLPYVLPHGYDVAASQESPPRYSSARSMHLLYAGVFYGAQQPDTFLHALRAALNERPELRIMSVFAGLIPPNFSSLVSRLGLEDYVETLGYLSSVDAARRMATADVLWMTVGHQKRGDQIVTSKLYAYFGSRRPILGLVPPGAARDQLERYGAARLADPDDVRAAAHHLISLYDDWRNDRLPTPDAHFVSALSGSAVGARAAARLDRLLDSPSRTSAEG